ncbi:unnamed protein product [Linum trigynum]|uniref:Uncharacterized protein n=1 Tax=Linum trigynum TaxID=586398 RepID=A0AAV2ECP4_9ROSI
MLETDDARFWRMAERTWRSRRQSPLLQTCDAREDGWRGGMKAVDCWREGREVTNSRGWRRRLERMSGTVGGMLLS